MMCLLHQIRWSHQKALAYPWGIKGRAMSGVRAQQRSPGNHPKCRHQQKSLSPPERWTPHRGPGVEYPAEATLDGDGWRNHPMEPNHFRRPKNTNRRRHLMGHRPAVLNSAVHRNNMYYDYKASLQIQIQNTIHSGIQCIEALALGTTSLRNYFGKTKF